MRDPSNLTVLLQDLTNRDPRRAVTPKATTGHFDDARSDW